MDILDLLDTGSRRSVLDLRWNFSFDPVRPVGDPAVPEPEHDEVSCRRVLSLASCAAWPRFRLVAVTAVDEVSRSWL